MQHLRKYFLFNYDNDYRIMLDNNLIGLKDIDIDLSNIYYTSKHEHELIDIFKRNNINNKQLLDIYHKFMFDINIGDAICLVDNKHIKAIGIIESNYQFNKNKELAHIHKVEWLDKKDIDFEDGNNRIKIREIEKEENYRIVENIINEYTLTDNDNAMLINYPSRITLEQYIDFFKMIHLNPNELELLNSIYNYQDKGTSIYELQKSYENIDVQETLELLARKISKYFHLEAVDESYLPNIFNGKLKDGHICMILKTELEDALYNVRLIRKQSIVMDGYSPKQASFNSVYPEKYFTKARDLLLVNGTLHLIGPWQSGKSYFAKRLAFLINDSRNLDQILHLKMHESLSYYHLLIEQHNRILYRFLEKARKNSIYNYVVIIEDIHLCNLNKVLGELCYLIEDNSREKETALDVLFCDGKYHLPHNVYFILTSTSSHNNIDSTNLSNILLFEMNAMYNDKFINMFNDKEFSKWLVKVYTELNIVLLKYNFSINHGLFLKKERGINQEEYEVVVNYKIKPLLKRIMNNEEYDKYLKIISEKIISK